MTEVTFTDAAIDDLRRIGPDTVPKVLKKVLILLDPQDAGYPLGGELTGFRKLADVIERLGKLSGGVTVPAQPTREPVPDWLAQRLIHTVGMAPQDVAALSLEEAVDRWGEFTSKPR